MNEYLVLVVEDDKPIRNLITTTLKMNDYRFITAVRGNEAIMLSASHKPDIIILDLGLPDIDGVEVIEHIRTWSDVPIIIVSARSEERDKITALDKGADDYLTKPFRIMELISRVKALLRRTSREQNSRVLEIGTVRMDDEKHKVTAAGADCELTFKEYELLKLLMTNAGIVTSREEILEKVWGTNFEGESRTLDMHIKTLRQKLGETGSLIKTVRNVGYIFSA